jgi:hypothetical protein
MKILSLNCRGLASPTKKSSLKRLITVHNPDIIFLQETMGISEIVTRALEALLPGWSFVAIDAKGCSGGWPQVGDLRVENVIMFGALTQGSTSVYFQRSSGALWYSSMFTVPMLIGNDIGTLWLPVPGFPRQGLSWEGT